MNVQNCFNSHVVLENPYSKSLKRTSEFYGLSINQTKINSTTDTFKNAYSLEYQGAKIYCSKSTIETLEKGVKYKKHCTKTDVSR